MARAPNAIQKEHHGFASSMKHKTMNELENYRKALATCVSHVYDVVFPAMEEADKAVAKYGFTSYMDMETSMLEATKRAMQMARKIKAMTTIEEERGDMEELLENFGPLINEILPSIQNALVDSFSIEDFDNSGSDPSVSGLVRFITA